jgi:cation diffusion facilitator CzcD-associated flavoprotein CzcO
MTRVVDKQPAASSPPCDSSPMTGSVAVIGAGPGGLVAARWLLSQGFEPTIFERAPMLGGQWTGLDGRSGVWPTMHTNTSRILTAFSDLDHGTDVVYPSGRDILDYLHRYAEAFDLVSRIRFGTHVDVLSRGDDEWLVRHSGTIERFDRVVVATGRFQSPAVPTVPGLDTFTGSAGITSTYQYRGPEPYRGKRVLVAGGAISAMEIAAEVAQLGAARVVVTQRRQRYVLPKFAAGVPSDHRMFTRYGTIANEHLPAAEIDRQLKEIVVEAGGSPEQYGAPAPDPSLFAAGVTLSQHYLPLVAEGLITVRPWMPSIAKAAVTFADGTAEEFDGIVFGTGFDLHLPFLDEDIRAVPATREADQWASVDAYRARRGMSQKTRMNLAALAFARAAGVEPSPDHWPHLRRALLFGPLAPSCFRLEGPDALPDAATRFARDAAAFGAITSNELTEREQGYWLRVQDAVAEELSPGDRSS